MPIQNPLDEPLEPLDPEQVATYLRQNPDFFVDYEQLLSELVLPHHTGEHAISLVERQVSVLRARNRDVRHRLARLLDAARDNDRLFHKTRKLVLDILAETSVAGVVNATVASLRDDYQVDTCSCLLVADPTMPNPADEQDIDHVRRVPVADIHAAIGALLHSKQPVCGHLRPAETAFLFPDATHEVQSAAVVQLVDDDTLIGILAIGSFDADQYRSGSGTLFLGYLADVLNRVLPRLSGA